MKFKFVLLFILTFSSNTFTSLPVIAQGVAVKNSAERTVTIKPSDCIESISGNRYRFYYDRDYNLTRPLCASIYRETRFDPELVAYHGNFKDYTSQGKLIVEGNYKNGALDSTCSVYYSNGNLWQKGNFENGRMIGEWMYYYPDGSLMYELKVVDTSFRLTNLWDRNGQQLVKDGNGKATVSHFSSTSTLNTTQTHWSGNVKNGKLDGVWKEYKGGLFTGVEELYRSGKFIKGYKGKQRFDIISYLSLEQDLNFAFAELFQLAACTVDQQEQIILPYYPEGETRLYKELFNRIGFVQPKKHEILPTVATVSFTVNTDGSLSDFKSVTTTGLELSLIRALEALGPWEPASLKATPVAHNITYSYIIKYRSGSRYPGPNKQTWNEKQQDRRDTERTFNPPSIYSNGKFH